MEWTSIYIFEEQIPQVRSRALPDLGLTSFSLLCQRAAVALTRKACHKSVFLEINVCSSGGARHATPKYAEEEKTRARATIRSANARATDPVRRERGSGPR